MPKEFILKELSRYKVGTYGDIIYRNALLYPDQMAFKCGGEQVTFSECNARTNRLIHALTDMGVKKGEVLGVYSWNCIEYTDVYAAAMKGGFVSSPYNARLKVDELDYLINYSEATTLFVGPEMVETVQALRPRLPHVRNIILFKDTAPDMISYGDLTAQYPGEEPDVQVQEEDPAFIFYTSGTTGVPSTPRPAAWTTPGGLPWPSAWSTGTSISRSCLSFMWAARRTCGGIFLWAGVMSSCPRSPLILGPRSRP